MTGAGAKRWIAAVIAVAALAAAGGCLREAVRQDACLDAGGAWQDGACRR